MIKNFILIAILSAVMMSTVILIFINYGSPFEVRKKRSQDLQANNLQELEGSVQSFYIQHSRLPNSLDELVQSDPAIKSKVIDPETQQDFIYQRTGDLTYQFCSKFIPETDSCSQFSVQRIVQQPFEEEDQAHPVIGIPIEPKTGAFFGLSARLASMGANFEFNYSGKSTFYSIDVSTQPNMLSDVYKNFGLGTTSPIMVTDPMGRWNKYKCGATLYWRVLTLEQDIVSDIQTAKVNCPS